MRRLVLLTIASLIVSLLAAVVGAQLIPVALAESPAAPPLPVFPRRLAEVQMGQPDALLQDLVIDGLRGRVYVTDGAGNLHALDSDSYATLATLPGAGDLTLDTLGHRLYASTQTGEEGLAVVDTSSLVVEGTIFPGGQVAVDSRRGRLYVGNPLWGDPSPDTPGVRVYDADTLRQIAEIDQPGLPIYNPLRDELMIVGYTAYLADPDTLQVTHDLLPEITSQPLRWCNGCLAAVNAHVFPQRDLLVVQMTELSAGKGAGRYPPHRFYDAATLDEITDPAAQPPVEGACEGQIVLGEPIRGRVYRGDLYSRYLWFNNLLVYDSSGNLLTWRDGLSLGVSNPRTGQMYVPHRDDVLVLDLEALSPLGALPIECVHTVDAMTGQLYAFGKGRLSVFTETGGQPRLAPTSAVDGLPTEEITSIQVSAAYARDRVLFVAMSGRLFRSTDGGQSWAQLRGGLPEGDSLALDLAVSPDFATDRTLYAGGFRGTFWGEGVYRSVDGGDTWQPAWNGLTHLRVYHVAVSPNYASDGTLIAYARYQRIASDEGGESVFRSNDRGLSWALVTTLPQGQSLPAPSDLLPAASAAAELPAPTMRARGYGEGVERSFDGGYTWEPVAIPGQPDPLFVKTVLRSPDRSEGDTYYAITEFDLLRTPDRGDTWQRCADARLAGRDTLERSLSAAAVSPWLGNERYQLFVGTEMGELLLLDPSATPWAYLGERPEPPPPTVPPTAAPPGRVACSIGPAERLAGVYADSGVAARLGCATLHELAVWCAYQPFERGQMIWLGDLRTIVVLESRGTWARYPDTWDDTQPASDPALATPPGLHQPVRGFGMVWREQLGGPQATVGWATNEETGVEITRQEFERGIVLAGPEGTRYVLYADGTWERW